MAERSGDGDGGGGSPLPAGRQRGIVIKIIEERGFAFLRSDRHSADIFMHRSDVTGWERITLNAEVEFQLGFNNRTRKPKASKAVVLSPDGSRGDWRRSRRPHQLACALPVGGDEGDSPSRSPPRSAVALADGDGGGPASSAAVDAAMPAPMLGLIDAHAGSPVDQITARQLLKPPSPPADAVDRADHVLALKRTLLDGGQDAGIVGVAGMGGIGKTVLAQMLAADDEVHKQFPDGVLWLTLGEKRTHEWILGRQQAIVEAMGHTFRVGESVEDRTAAVTEALDERKCLVVLDDVWHMRDAKAFGCPSGAVSCRYLLTTRNRDRLTDLRAAEHPLEMLNEKQSRRLLTHCAGTTEDATLPEESSDIIELCDGLPLAIAVVGGMLRKRKSEWRRLTRLLQEGKHDKLFASEQALSCVFGPSIDDLKSVTEFEGVDMRERLLDLVVFAEDEDIPEHVLYKLWMSLGVHEDTVEPVIDELVNRHLVSRAGAASGCVRLHGLMRGYIRRLADTSVVKRHTAVVDMYRARCEEAGDGGGWARGPMDDDYYVSHLAYHLKEAGKDVTVLELVTDYEWIAARLKATGVLGVRADCALGGHEAQLVWDSVQLSQHALLDNQEELGWQLSKRLAGRSEPRLAALVEQSRAAAPVWAVMGCSGPGAPTMLTTPGGPLVQTISVRKPASCAAVLDEGRQVVAGLEDGAVQVLDVKSGRCVQTMEKHTKNVMFVVMLANSGRVVTGSWDSTLCVWDMEKGECVAHARGSRSTHNGINCGAPIADGRGIAVGLRDGSLAVWNLEKMEKMEKLYTLQEHADSVFCISASDNVDRESAVAVSGSKDGLLCVWDLSLSSGTLLYKLDGHTNGVVDVALYDNGRRALSGSWDETLRVWDLTQRCCIRKHDMPDSVTAMATDTAGSRAVVSIVDGRVVLYDLRAEDQRELGMHQDRCVSVSLLDDDRCLTASRDGTLCFWDMKPQDTPTGGIAARGKVQWDSSVVVLPDGRWALSGSKSGTMKRWDLETRTRPDVVDSGHGKVWQVALMPNGRHAVLASQDGTAQLWDVESLECLHVFRGHKEDVACVAALDETRVATGSRDETVRIWSVLNGKCMHVLLHEEWVNDVVPLGDGFHLVSGSGDNTVRVWDVSRGKCTAVLREHTDWVQSLAPLGDDRHVVSGSKDRTLRVWDAIGETCLSPVQCPAEVLAIAVLPGGRRVAACCENNALCVCDVQSSTVLHTVHFDDVPRAIASLSGDELVICLADTVVTLAVRTQGRDHGDAAEAGSAAGAGDGKTRE